MVNFLWIIQIVEIFLTRFRRYTDMNKENQARIIELVKQAKPLILQEMAHEKVTEKGAADYVTNVDEGGSWKRISGHCTDC